MSFTFKLSTVKSAYKEPAYKEPAYKKLPVIRNWFLFPILFYKELVHYMFIRNSSYTE